ncbi:MAG: hypothetical protein ACLGJC_28055 [Alphaproteobacteria bacterium]
MTYAPASRHVAGLMMPRHAELVEKITAFSEALLDDPDAATALATLGAQPADATLTALAGLVTSANKLIYATGADAFSITDLTAFARTLLDDPDAATALATLGALALTGGTLTGPVKQSVTTLTAASNTFTPDCSLSNEFDCGTVVAASIIANPTNVPAAGKVQPLSIKWTQDATGGRTMSFGANCINVGGTSANTAAGKVNFAVGKIYSDGKFYYSIVKGA